MRCEELKLIFIGICKTGSTSIVDTFKKKYKITGKAHSIKNFTYKLDSTITKITEDDFNNYKLFTVIRNPYDRIVSLWLWGQKIYRVSFKEFVNNIYNNKYAATIP